MIDLLQAVVPPLQSGTGSTELDDAAFQALITAGLAVFALLLYRRLPQRWFAWWAAAWALYVARLGAIIAFLATGNLIWLFWHQVITGWVALAILWAALVFSRDSRWRGWYAILALFPLALGWFAVKGVDQVAVVAVPMVALISGATLWTGWVFWRYGRQNDSPVARFVALVFTLWGLHHIDYPILRARGAWQPWGYFLDIVFELAVGIGFGMMVLSELARRLAQRTDELGHLSALMVRQHEAERRRLSRDLHDETAQTLSAVKLEVGMLREGSDAATDSRLDHVLQLVDNGIRGIRRVMNDLRPALLDDLGLLPAIRSLADDMRERSPVIVEVDLAETVPRLGAEAELGLFRAAQEALANVVRHANATHVTIELRTDGDRVSLTVRDNGRGFPEGRHLTAFEREGHLGLAGMRERITALGGSVVVGRGHPAGALITVELPVGQ
ncbi:MAG TPA: sensor histidine kinase [Gemmatimonadales bacterium]|jgi:signal transduction histidine kinase|nr:sensor histidine kinase [Gemmatimonadales bacterium]